MALRVVIFALLAMGLVFGVALIFTTFFWMGWNWGVVPALGFAREVTLAQAFWLSLCISAVGGMFKSNLTMKDD